MEFQDFFKPYSPELRGDLKAYLRDREECSADNLFFGPEYFFEIKKRGFLIPDVTSIRVNRSPIPDLHYFVNFDYMLESTGMGEHNMSMIGAEKGVYDPKEALKDKLWSIHNLNLDGPE